MPRATRRFMRQKMMDHVLIALAPVLAGGIWFFGWRVAAMTAWVMLVGCAAEYGMARRRGDPLTEACLVSCALFALSLPPTLPFWMAAVGIVVGIVFGKEVFGGFGRNIFNPAIVGRAFLYVCFPVAMTAGFTPVWRGGLAGLGHWGARRVLDGMQAVTAATPMWSRRDYGFETDTAALFLGNIGRVFTGSDGVRRVLAAGAVGEVSALLVLAGGLYLLWKKTANWRLTAACLGGATTAVVIFRHILGAQAVPSLGFTFFSGALLYAAFFMVTDPVSAPRHGPARIVYGMFIGFMIVLFRWKAVFAGGAAFAILLGNTVAPTVEIVTKGLEQWKKDRRKPAPAPGAPS